MDKWVFTLEILVHISNTRNNLWEKSRKEGGDLNSDCGNNYSNFHKDRHHQAVMAFLFFLIFTLAGKKTNE